MLLIPHTPSVRALEDVEPTFRPLFKALALFPPGASVELWRLSGLLKPIVTRLNIKRKARGMGKSTIVRP